MNGKPSELMKRSLCRSVSVKRKMDTSVHSLQLHNSGIAISYCTVCFMNITILKLFPVLHKLLYIMQFNYIQKLHESLFGNAVALSRKYNLCSRYVVKLSPVLHRPYFRTVVLLL